MVYCQLPSICAVWQWPNSRQPSYAPRALNEPYGHATSVCASPILARVLRGERVRLGKSQEALAREANVTVARIEHEDADPTWTAMRSIAAGLGLSLVDLRRAVERES
jgi:DNA-binding XRE family transcriptional regulator